MISFPIVRSLIIKKYGFFPGSENGAFTATFYPGPNAIAGVNGSGKTTLINIALRCLTGPYNLPSPTSESELGQVRPRVIQMSRYDRQLFARRVADGASNGTSTLILSFARKQIQIERSLSDLSLVSFSIDGVAQSVSEDQSHREEYFQTQIAALLGVASFFDVVIILSFLIFMLEDRRALVWDPTAQRQIFRVLLLPTDRATEYASAQQNVVSADSAVRNTSTLIKRHEGQIVARKKQAKKLFDAEAERRLLSAEAEVVRQKIETAVQDRLEADVQRHSARLDRLKAAEARESTIRELERIKLDSLKAVLGPSDENLRYVINHLLAEQRCLVCGTDPSPAAAKIKEWARLGRCPVCGSQHDVTGKVVPLTEANRRRIERLEKELDFSEKQMIDAEARMAAAQLSFEKTDNQYNDLERKRISLDSQIVAVLGRIPTERAAIGVHESNVDALRRILANERRRLKKAENRFRLIVAESVKRVQDLQEQIASSFRGYLRVFMKEKAELVYQAVKGRVGQAGASFEFPAFHLTMTSGAVAGQTMRNSPNEVSQSQAEFIDLAFRMALMSVAADGGPATLVVDAPEASLDFLSATRAGEQLAKFSCARPENRVIITSYLPSHHLLLSFFKNIHGDRERTKRVVNLISDAAPNAALRADRAKYEAFLAHVIANRSA